MLKRFPEPFPIEFVAAQRSRNRLPASSWARLAMWYSERVQVGDRNPAQTAVDRFPETALKTWQNAFSRCRAEGLLTAPPRRGIAGGLVTELALAHLGLADDEPHPELRAEYLATRDDSGPTSGVRSRQRPIKSAPRLSSYAGDAAAYNEAWDQWTADGQWVEVLQPVIEPWARPLLGEDFSQRYDDWFSDRATLEG